MDAAFQERLNKITEQKFSVLDFNIVVSNSADLNLFLVQYIKSRTGIFF